MKSVLQHIIFVKLGMAEAIPVIPIPGILVLFTYLQNPRSVMITLLHLQADRNRWAIQPTKCFGSLLSH